MRVDLIHTTLSLIFVVLWAMIGQLASSTERS